ncbi:hypothetical protein [Nocardia brasiliensis]|nr:hypothetical protein [Nocardia brasiliensis]
MTTLQHDIVIIGAAYQRPIAQIFHALMPPTLREIVRGATRRG